MHDRKALALLASAFAILFMPAFAQETGGPTKLVKIQRKSGKVAIGEFLAEKDGEVSWLDLVTEERHSAPRSELITFDKNIPADVAIARVGFPVFLSWQVKDALGLSRIPGKVIAWDPPIAKVSLGAEDRIRKGQELLVFRVGEDVTDPDTGEVLGKDVREIARLEVQDINRGFCNARAQSRPSEPIRVGDVVRVEGDRKRVAVLPPRFSEPLKPEVAARLQSWSRAVVTRWTSILKQHGVPVIERASMPELRKEAALKGSDQELGKRLGADAVIVGTLVPQEARAQIRLVDVASGRVLCALTEELELPEIPALKKQLIKQKLQSKLKKKL
jgi:TolB-like protein